MDINAEVSVNFVNLELNDAEAMALAQFVKRVGWQEMRVNAVDDAECYLIVSAIAKLQRTLANEGFAPR